MLIFYVKNKSSIIPVVIIDALSSDDRFDKTEIIAEVRKNAPDKTALSDYQIFSCEYTAQFEHVGVPMGQSIKTKFSGTLKSPPASLVKAFSPQFLTSQASLSDLTNSLSKIPNAQTSIVYSAFVVKGASGNMISRKFITYSAPLYPDPYGTTTTMIISGSMIDDIMIKQTSFCQIDKESSLKSQLETYLSEQEPPWKGNFDNAPNSDDAPATEILLQPMTFFSFLREISEQNKMIAIPDPEKMQVEFWGQGQENAPKSQDSEIEKFSFLGSAGNMAWGLGVENYVNIKFKTAIFDCKLFKKIVLYNDIQSSFFEGLISSPSPVTTFKEDVKTYDAWIIRYVIKWSRLESICQVTASNNWLMGIFRIDQFLESAIYQAADL